jgi:predicted outer membrane repeat protein
MRTIIISSIFLLFLLLSANTEAGIIHVPADSSTIQAGINGASDGDTVLVARGHYYENINFLGKKIVLASHFVLKGDTTLISKTILDGGKPDNKDSASVVRFISGEDSSSVIIGFTIQNGSGVLILQPNSYGGGGIICKSSSPKIVRNIIKNNFAYAYGGGIYCQDGSPQIIQNTIMENSTNYFGGGIFCNKASPKIEQSILESNSAKYGRGGGIHCYSATPLVKRNLIFGNTCYLEGGGVCCESSASALIINNTFVWNKSVAGSGIGCIESSSPKIVNNIISFGEGASLWCDKSSNPFITHNDFWNNAGGNFHGCPAGVGDTRWGTDFNGTACDSFYNIMRDPLFADIVSYELLCNSLCIDAGDPSIYVPIDSGGCRIDMGVHEYPYVLGDANSDSSINVVDVVFAINCLFINGPPPCPYHAADTNCDGLVEVTDIVCLINYLFIGGPLPCGF